MKKVVIINGSPRKKWNTAQLLKKFKEGMGSAFHFTEFNVYDYQFTGCCSCFACKLKRFEEEPAECRIRDDIHDLLVETREADAVVIGSPIYFLDLSAQLKAFLERLMYPGNVGKALPVTFIHTMNTDEEGFKNYVWPSVSITYNYWKSNFNYEPKVFISTDTYQRDHEELYKKSHADMNAKKVRHDRIWTSELQRAKAAGEAFAEEISQ